MLSQNNATIRLISIAAALLILRGLPCRCQVSGFVSEVVKLVGSENGIARVTALRTCANIAALATSLPPVLRAPCDEALVLLTLLCETLSRHASSHELSVCVRLLAGLTGFHDSAGAKAREWILDKVKCPGVLATR